MSHLISLNHPSGLGLPHLFFLVLDDTNAAGFPVRLEISAHLVASGPSPRLTQPGCTVSNVSYDHGVIENDDYHYAPMIHIITQCHVTVPVTVTVENLSECEVSLYHEHYDQVRSA